MTLPLAQGTGGLAVADLAARADDLARSGPAALRELRRQALENFIGRGLPTVRDEEWKYTSVRALESGAWWVRSTTGDLSARSDGFFEDGSVRITVVDGVLLKTEGVLPDGLTVTTLENSPEAVRLLGQSGAETTTAGDRTIVPDDHVFAALNTALFPDVTVVHVRSGADIAPVVEIENRLTPSADGSKPLVFPRLLIVAEEGSSVKIVESFTSDDGAEGAVVPVTEVFVRRGASVEHVRVQDQSLASLHLGVWQTRQAGSSEYKSYNVCLGAATARVDQSIWLEGEDAVTRLDGVVCAAGEQHIDNHTRLDHAVPECNSFEIYKQVVADKATVVFNGKIFVHQDAQKSDAKQTNQALLLSPTATIDSKPQLEIFADDVKCTHGATVGQLEDTPLFYMRQRGVPEDTAKAVLVYAFAAEVVELISMGQVRDALERKLYRKLGVDLS